MDIVYKQAFAEVLEVLKFSSKSILEKIPKRFIKFLTDNKDDDYIVNIDFSKQNWEDDIKEETQAILGLIYRDYVVSPEKRAELIKEENEEQIRTEKEQAKKYNQENLSKEIKEEKIENQNEENVEANTNLLAEIKNGTFLTRLINFIKELFNKTN